MVNSRANKLFKSLAIKFCVAVITFSIGITAYLVWSVTPVQPAAPTQPAAPPQPVEVDYESAEIGTLKRSILEAKAKGWNTVELSSIGCGSDIGSLKTTLSRDTVVLAELVEKKTYADTWGLRTWYKFKSTETLVKHPPPRFLSLPFTSGPSEMLPVAEDEFLIQEINGQMEIDGITVTQYSNGAKYVEGQTYLLFLWIDPSNRTAARSGSDPLGVFLVDSDGNLRPYVDRENRLHTELGKRYQNSVDNLRQALKK